MTTIRETYNDRLAALQDDLLSMGRLVDQAIDLAICSLSNRDKALAKQVIDNDAQINQALRDIEEKCLVLIATQQPLASDLRIILSVSSIATEMERMGDYAKGIAQITLNIADQPLLKPLIDIPRMAAKGRQLLHDQLAAFIHRDADTARRLSAEDDEIDALYDQVYRELLIFMMQDPRTVDRATHLLWVAHNLERIGDRTTNIGERTAFLVTGQVEELNP
ncbi:MAG: phosphate signaling complex protein PhoU [Anaerolineae bacterium]|jgi:phosphate transport system protein|nr:phosphate signaling complex protein PhoU [Anaerolineae bacterium]MDH7472589.1 phosphate signaling complex protein PhoU [Anaerolineae bacterium]